MLKFEVTITCEILMLVAATEVWLHGAVFQRHLLQPSGLCRPLRVLFNRQLNLLKQSRKAVEFFFNLRRHLCCSVANRFGTRG